MESRDARFGDPDPRAGKILHGYAILVAGATFLLIFVGGLVTSTGSGLAVPDWPLSFGRFFPPMEGGVLFEHGHRMAAAFVGLLTLIMMVWVSIRKTPPVVRWLASAALLCVVVQGVLGGVTVLLRLPLGVSVAHACLAQAFFCITIALTLFTGRSPGRPRGKVAFPRGDRLLVGLAAATTGLVFAQLILGALMRHLGAGLAIPDFPLAFGQILPPLTSAEETVHFLHRVGAVVVTVFFGATSALVILRHRSEPRLLIPAALGSGLVLFQLALGATVIWTQIAVLPTTAHVALGAGILACGLVLSIRSAQGGTLPAVGPLPRTASVMLSLPGEGRVVS